MAACDTRAVGAIGLFLALTVPMATAQEPPVRVRGTIDRVDDGIYVVKARGGAELKVKLAADARGGGADQASSGRHQAGTYVGVAGMPLADGTQKALEVTSAPRPCGARVMAIAGGTCSRRAP